jgi:hypothetical protein
VIRSDNGFNTGSTPTFDWRDLGNLRRISLRIAGVPVETRTGNLSHTSYERHYLSHVARFINTVSMMDEECTARRGDEEYIYFSHYTRRKDNCLEDLGVDGIILWRIRRYFRNERCYSTVGYGLGVSYETTFPNTRGQRKMRDRNKQR